ncbi:uncharacterized protein LOC111868637 isoform X2 [Cryptotermes secundus]|uniref:uncharacterized protein LOC111868637 isoform X2 n=1 Tax=Cryptotermes secundus TaxID=105785 RepID=UPI000CD7ADF5|nr:uncharacterized protein LOC111868637 isoform X2 [Cryptotermes secundus]
MATENEGSASSSGDELDGLHYLKPPSWKQRSAVQIIDIQSPVEYNSQNIEQTSSAKNKATNSSKVSLSEEKSTSELQNMNVEKSVLESLCGIQHLPSDVLEQVSDSKMRPEITGVANPTSAKQKILISGELQNRCIEVKDAECQTELTGKLLAGLEKGQDVGSQTISTGDVISLNLYYGNLSSDKLSNTMCDPGNEGLYNCTTLKDIENYEDTFQDQILQ